MRLFNSILNFIFPHSCVVCGTVGVDVCLKCLDKVRPYVVSKCVYCGEYTTNGETHASCKRKDGLNGLFILFPYSPVVRASVHAAKYRNVRGALTDLILSKGATHVLLNCKRVVTSSTLFVPIPLSGARHRLRGYNQATYIAEILTKLLGSSVDTSILKRKIDTKPQSRLKSGVDRISNVKGAFEVSKGVSYDSIGLVDDVWKTGSTIMEVCKELKHHAKCRVYALVLSGKV